MKIINTPIADLKIIEPIVFTDSRGFFFESFNHNQFEYAIGRQINFFQDNHSRSRKGVIRGLHYQLPPNAQAKLVRCIFGEIFDIAVDIRHSSPTFGRWFGAVLSAENKCQLWIPEGFAHGFLTLSEQAEVLYKASNYYAPESERGIRWDDSTIKIHWKNVILPLLSDKDKQYPLLREAEVFK